MTITFMPQPAFSLELEGIIGRIHDTVSKVSHTVQPYMDYAKDTMPRFRRETQAVFQSVHYIPAAFKMDGSNLAEKMWMAFSFTAAEALMQMAQSSMTTKALWYGMFKTMSSLSGCTAGYDGPNYRFEVGDKVQVLDHVDPYPHYLSDEPAMRSQAVANQICVIESRSPGFGGEGEPLWYRVTDCTSNSGLSHAASGSVAEPGLALYIEPTAEPTAILPTAMPTPIQDGCYLTDSSGANNGHKFPLGQVDPKDPNSWSCIPGNKWYGWMDGKAAIIPGGTPP
jgi:hypothetical protein